MKKTILTTLMVMCIAFVGFATETNVTTVNSHDYEFSAYKTTPFCMAIVKGDLETVKKLIELGSDVNRKSDGMTPLMYAARYNRVEIIKILVKEGANIKTKDPKGFTAMKFAELSNAKEAMVLLKELS